MWGLVILQQDSSKPQREKVLLRAVLKGSGAEMMVPSTLPIKTSGAVNSLEERDAIQRDLDRLEEQPLQTF